MRLIVLFLCLSSGLGCVADAKSVEAEELVARFQHLADAGDLDALQRAFPLGGANINHYIAGQRTIGRRVRVSRATVDDLSSGPMRQISLVYNSEFERGRAMEVFQILIRDGGTPTLETYSSAVGKELQCPWLFASWGRCETVDVPAS
jgi:hypothetical protein